MPDAPGADETGSDLSAPEVSVSDGDAGPGAVHEGIGIDGSDLVPPLAADTAGLEDITPEERLDPGERNLVDQLLDSAGVTQRRDLYRSIFGTVVHMAEENTDPLDLKLARAALAEMAEAFRVFRPFRDEHKVTFFGSARTLPDDPL